MEQAAYIKAIVFRQLRQGSVQLFGLQYIMFRIIVRGLDQKGPIYVRNPQLQLYFVHVGYFQHTVAYVTISGKQRSL